MPLEILHGAFVLLGGRSRVERAGIAALAGLRIHFTGIEPVLNLICGSWDRTPFGVFIALVVIAALLFRSRIRSADRFPKSNADVSRFAHDERLFSGKRLSRWA
jgi:hypothetical protein